VDFLLVLTELFR